jgi:acetyl esterase/lipase
VPQPAGAVLLSAPTDLTGSSPSAKTNAQHDCMMGPNASPFTWQVYLGTTPPERPDASPLFGDWRGLPRCTFMCRARKFCSTTAAALSQAPALPERARKCRSGTM